MSFLRNLSLREKESIKISSEYQYDDLSRRTLLTYGNDANIVYSYDLGNRLKRLTNNINETEAIDFNYADYDKLGNRKSCKINDANTQVYDYDKLYQLVYVDYNDGNETWYYYDKLGNRTLMTYNTTDTIYDSNTLNQYVTVSGTSYEYDKNGNLTYDGVQSYAYDCENRLLTVDAGSTASYKYDFAGRRIAKTAGGVTTTYLYDGDSVIAEYQGTTCVRKYIFGPGIDEPIAMIAGANTYYYYFDGLGSVVALSDDSGNIVEKYEYDVFGKPTILSPDDELRETSAYGNRFMFTGREYDSETGLYYYRARYYRPEIGRFLQTDPIGYTASLNLYAYVGNNPIMRVDPLGLLSVAFYNTDESQFKHSARYAVGKKHAYPMDISFSQAAAKLENLDAPVTDLYLFSHNNEWLGWGDTEIEPGGAIDEWKRIGNAMEPGGMIHLMGCYLGTEEYVRNFVQEVANLTGKRVKVYTGPITHAGTLERLLGMPAYWYGEPQVKGKWRTDPAFVIVRPEIDQAGKPCK